jgi:hypothetical protein
VCHLLELGLRSACGAQMSRFYFTGRTALGFGPDAVHHVACPFLRRVEVLEVVKFKFLPLFAQVK